jgi:type I restriction enzyme, S subunit
VGRVVLTPPFLANEAIQDDVLKVIPETKQLAHYLYTYFSSPIGNGLLGDAAFGSVVQHIKVDHVRELPVFRISTYGEKTIAKLVESAVTARASAHELLQAAKNACLTANRLPALPGPVSGWLVGDKRHVAFLINAQTVAANYAAVGELRLEAHFYNPSAHTANANIKKCAARTRTVAELSHDVIMGGRFKRNYVTSAYGTPFLSGRNIIQVRPADLKHLSNSETEDLNDMLVKRGWILISCSGTIGRACFVWHNFEDYAASQHILRVLPDTAQVDPGYLYAFLASDYGYQQIIRFRHGSVIDEITDHQLKQVIIPLPSQAEQDAIGDTVREAYEKRAAALRLEDEAQEILMREIEGSNDKDRQHV